MKLLGVEGIRYLKANPACDTFWFLKPEEAVSLCLVAFTLDLSELPLSPFAMEHLLSFWDRFIDS